MVGIGICSGNGAGRRFSIWGAPLCFFSIFPQHFCAGLGLDLRSPGGDASVLARGVGGSQGRPFDLLHFSDGILGVLFTGGIDFYFSAHGIHLPIRPALIAIVGPAHNQAGAGPHVGPFMGLDFLVGFFEFSDFALLPVIELSLARFVRGCRGCPRLSLAALFGYVYRIAG